MYLFLLHLFFIFRMLCMKSVYIPIVINNTFLSWTFQKWKRSAIKINTYFVWFEWMHNKPQKIKSTFLEFLFIWKKHRFQPFWKNNYYITPQIPLFLIIQSSVLYVHTSTYMYVKECSITILEENEAGPTSGPWLPSFVSWGFFPNYN